MLVGVKYAKVELAGHSITAVIAKDFKILLQKY